LTVLKGIIMSTELAIATERGQSIEDLMGLPALSAENNKVPSSAMLKLVHSPIKGEVEFNGKKIKTDVIPTGSFALQQGDDIVYSDTVTVRIFAIRQQYKRYNSSTNEMERTVLANSLNSDLKDSIGTYNLGRPSGYIEDFKALPQSIQEIVRSVNRHKIYYGTLTLDNPVDATGQALSDVNTDIPFTFDSKNRDSLKSIDAAITDIRRKNMLMIGAGIKFQGVEDSIPTGATYAKVEASVGDVVELSEQDNDTMRSVLEMIEYSNGKILDLHEQRSKDGLSDSRRELVNDFIEVEAE
jgi:hypothetical protein